MLPHACELFNTVAGCKTRNDGPRLQRASYCRTCGQMATAMEEPSIGKAADFGAAPRNFLTIIP